MALSPIHAARDLSPEEKSVVEKFLGRSLADDESFDIQAYRCHPAPQGEDRQAAWKRLNSVTDRMAEKAKRLSDDDLDALLVDKSDPANRT